MLNNIRLVLNIFILSDKKSLMNKSTKKILTYFNSAKFQGFSLMTIKKIIHLKETVEVYAMISIILIKSQSLEVITSNRLNFPTKIKRVSWEVIKEQNNNGNLFRLMIGIKNIKKIWERNKKNIRKIHHN
jgi:hypothetical protein